jgi:hypothetical protein
MKGRKARRHIQSDYIQKADGTSEHVIMNIAIQGRYNRTLKNTIYTNNGVARMLKQCYHTK